MGKIQKSRVNVPRVVEMPPNREDTSEKAVTPHYRIQLQTEEFSRTAEHWPRYGLHPALEIVRLLKPEQ